MTTTADPSRPRRARARASVAATAIAFAVLAPFGVVPVFAQTDMCIALADSGGEADGEDLLTIVDLSDLDPATNEVSIGTGTGTFGAEAAAFQPGSGVLFAADGDRLGTISLTTGRFTEVGAFGSGSAGGTDVTFDDVLGLSFHPSTGHLWGVHRRGGGQPDVLLRIDPATGAAVAGASGGDDFLVIQPLGSLHDIDDIAIRPSTGVMYGVANAGGSGDHLVTIDTATGATTDVGAIGVDSMEGLAFTPTGGLVGTSARVPGVSEGGVWDIDLSTGAASNPRTLDNGSAKEAIACRLSGAALPTPTPTVEPTLSIEPTITPSPSPTGEPAEPIVEPDIVRRPDEPTVLTEIRRLPKTGAGLNAGLAVSGVSMIAGGWAMRRAGRRPVRRGRRR